ncbi:hypothetical protein McanCB21832_003616 [Microsporum canis]
MSLSSNAVSTWVGHADISISKQGAVWYWAVTSIFTLSAIAFLVGSFVVRSPNVRFHYHLSALSSCILSVAYFAVGVDSGYENPTRHVFWIRYAGWLLATPILMTQTLLLINAPLKLILREIFMASIVMMTGLGGALVPNTYKWAYFVYGFFACTALGWTMLKAGYSHVRSYMPSLKKAYLAFGAFLSAVWLMHGACWGLGEAGNYISPASEAVFYGILDICGGPLCCVFLMWAAHRFCRVEKRELSRMLGREPCGTVDGKYLYVMAINRDFKRLKRLEETS